MTIINNNDNNQNNQNPKFYLHNTPLKMIFLKLFN